MESSEGAPIKEPQHKESDVTPEQYAVRLQVDKVVDGIMQKYFSDIEEMKGLSDDEKNIRMIELFNTALRSFNVLKFHCAKELPRKTKLPRDLDIHILKGNIIVQSNGSRIAKFPFEDEWTGRRADIYYRRTDFFKKESLSMELWDRNKWTSLDLNRAVADADNHTKIMVKAGHRIIHDSTQSTESSSE